MSSTTLTRVRGELPGRYASDKASTSTTMIADDILQRLAVYRFRTVAEVEGYRHGAVAEWRVASG